MKDMFDVYLDGLSDERKLTTLPSDRPHNQKRGDARHAKFIFEAASEFEHQQRVAAARSELESHQHSSHSGGDTDSPSRRGLTVGVLVIDIASTGVVGLHVTAISGATIYRIQVSTTGVGDWADLQATSSTTFNGAVSEDVLDFRYRAENSSGVSDWSPTVTDDFL